MIDRHQLESFVRTVPLFHDFTDEQIREVADSLTTREYSRGDRVVGGREPFGYDEHAEDDATLCFVVQGEFSARLRQPEFDLDVELNRYLPGESFGDTALLTGRRPYSYVEAVTEGLLLHLDKPRFDELLAGSPWFAQKLCRTLGRRLVDVVDRFGAVPYVKLNDQTELTKYARLLSPRVCKACKCLVLDRSGDRVRVGLVDPSDANARNFVASALKPWDVDWVAINHDDFQRYSDQLLRSAAVADSSSDEDAPLRYISPSGVMAEVRKAGNSPLLARLLRAAIYRGASDLHLEPGRDAASARIRVDGRMEPIADEIDAAEMRQIVSQIKVMCDLDITRAHAPMDGSCSLLASGTGGEKLIEARVSTMPCHGGEKAVVRLVSPQSHFSKLENLILSPSLSTLASQIVQSPNGLVLVTGPTGSGKTTTLYAALQTLWRENPAINVLTIEDPIEYSLPFATQVQINPEMGLTFPTVLRSVLRQDPDVVLVGEIRDAESAALAVGAATTGHLVLSSLHTHSSLETLARLRQLGVKNYLLADALRGVISQKLVPRLLPGAGAPVTPDDPAVERLKRLGVLPSDFYGELRRASQRGRGDQPVFTEDGETSVETGASEQGRVGVYEVLAPTDRLRRQIEIESPIGEIEESLEPGERISFAAYSRYLLENHLVAPERIERIFPRIDREMVRESLGAGA